MILSDHPGWRARAQHRRQFCAPDAAWIAVAECGWPYPNSELTERFHPERRTEAWRQSQIASNNYLRATGMAQTPSWVYGVGPRAIWPDDSGRWFVAHASTATVMHAARAHFFGAPAPTEPKIFTTHMSGPPTEIVRRNVGEPAATQGDVLKAAIAMIGLDPALCYGACAYGPPVMARVSEYTYPTIGDSGLALATTLGNAWHDEFRRRQPFTIPPSSDLPTPNGPIRVERFKWAAMHARAKAGDTTVAQSPVELAVSFAETIGVHASECWGIAERQPGVEPESAYAQITYRPRAEHDVAGRPRFVAYLASLGMTPADLDLGHPEGNIMMEWGGIRVIKH